MLVGAAEPGVVTLNQSGSGPGAILEQKADGSVTLNSAANPASPGDALMIYCTGLGTVSPAVAAGSAAPLSSLVYTDGKTSATVGGVNAQVLFSGLAPGWMGLYQVNVLVPGGITPASSVPVVLTTGGSASAPVMVAVRAQ